ncbi:hypothetical protein Ccrd_004673 [Cynara cardunculus var. scolymus]|uniref:Uncharacterized protein n=1 Tax=Cynara cardunculus var. scolymus TaxID=59895 RepID=A0A103XM71_CYNCS|nr:hypothetical protein Ccrd_004673 [Cynara cardunculus var. scolymus]
MKKEKGLFMGPRISFSNDFVESKNHHENMSYREAPVSSDFEFCVPSFSANSADEVFFKLPPLKEMNSKVTLRDELLAGGDDDDGYNSCKNSSSGTRWWREKFRLRKSQHKNHGVIWRLMEVVV